MLLVLADRLARGGCCWASGSWATCCYITPLPAPHPRGAEGRAAARAVVTGQVVDTITNMRTVKLFAHDEHEDEAAIRAMGRYRDRTLDYGMISTTFRFWLMVIAGILPVLLVGATLWLWTRRRGHGRATSPPPAPWRCASRR